MCKRKLLAIKNHDMLWKRYYNNEKKLTWAECKSLIGSSSIHLKRLTKSFKLYGLEVPPIWDDPPVKYLRISRKLCDLFPNDTTVTQIEMAKSTGISKDKMHLYIRRIKDFGYDLPDGYDPPEKLEQIELAKAENENENAPIRSICSGGVLQAVESSKRVLDDGSVAYRLK